MHIQDVINACHALVQAGKTPSIALVKTKLVNKVALAQIVKGIQQFQNSQAPELENTTHTNVSIDNEVSNVDYEEKQATSCTCLNEGRVSQLEKQVTQLTLQLTNIQKQVALLDPS